jgi:hypothetical protein
LEILGLGFLLDDKLARFLKGKNKERFENLMKKFRKKKPTPSPEPDRKDQQRKSA